MEQIINNYEFAFNAELDYLLEQKYSRNGKYLKYIYHGYTGLSLSLNKTEYESVSHRIPTSEFSTFILFDTNKQTSITVDYKFDIFGYIGLRADDKYELKMDLEKLLEKSRHVLNYRKLEILIMILFA